MEILRIRFTRGDYCTNPGGIIMRRRENGEYLVHNFNRLPGSKEPTDFFWGHYCDTEEKAIESFEAKLHRSRRYNAGGSLIDDRLVDGVLNKELEALQTAA